MLLYNIKQLIAKQYASIVYLKLLGLSEKGTALRVLEPRICLLAAFPTPQELQSGCGYSVDGGLRVYCSENQPFGLRERRNEDFSHGGESARLPRLLLSSHFRFPGRVSK